LAEACALSDFHKPIQFFTCEFLGDILQVDPVQYPKTGERLAVTEPLSVKETNRTQRLVCRFELVCNLFRREKLNGKYRSDEKRFDSLEIQQVFFLHHGFYECEQIGCIRTWLYAKAISPGYDYLITHDIRGAGLGIHVKNNFYLNSEFKKGLLSRGSGTIYRMMTAKTYEERRSAFNIPIADGQFIDDP
jgi:hypothetical protein